MVIDIAKMTLWNINDYESGKIKRCVICGKEFKTKRRNKKTCSSRCAGKLNYRKRKLKH